MNIFNKGYEAITALTNIIIFIISFIYFIKSKKINKNNLWTIFFFLIFLAGLFGSVIHGFNFSEKALVILWIILSFIFSVVINTLVMIFLNVKNKRVLKICLLTILIYSLIFIETLIGIDFLLTFIIYAALCLILCLVMCFKNKYNIYYLLAFLSQFVGGIFLIIEKIKIPFLLLDKNGIYHIFVLISLVFFYKGIKK